MKFQDDISKICARIEMMVASNVQLAIDNVPEEYITPARVLSKYVEIVLKDYYKDELTKRSGGLDRLLRGQDPDLWEGFLIDATDTLNYRAVFGITSRGMDEEAIELALSPMQGSMVLNVDEFYEKKILNNIPRGRGY